MSTSRGEPLQMQHETVLTAERHAAPSSCPRRDRKESGRECIPQRSERIETACAGRQQQRSLLLSAAHSLKGTLGQLTTISSLLARPLCLSPGSGSAISVPPPPVINVVTTTAAALDAKLNLICELFWKSTEIRISRNSPLFWNLVTALFRLIIKKNFFFSLSLSLKFF